MKVMASVATDYPVRGLAFVVLLTCLAGCSTQTQIRYPNFDPDEISDRIYDCASIDYAIQQVDSIRWSMRQDGTELETDYEQMVQLTSATLAVVASAVYYVPIPTWELAYTDADKLKKADALLIALLNKRRGLNCPPLTRCRLSLPNVDTLSQIEITQRKVESGEISESDGIQELTKTLDGMCDVGT